MTPEGKVKAAVKKRLKEVGAYQFWPVQTGFGARGVDCYACYKGRFLAVETKAHGKRPTGHQQKVLTDIDLAWGQAVVEDSEWLESLNWALKYIDEL